jgi:hypothetical protein
MRVADEITELPAPRPLPAPSGPRMPTSQIAVTLPALSAPVQPPKSDGPTFPRLPPVAPKATTPEAARVSSTLSLEAFLAANADGAGTGRSAPAPEKRKHKALIVLGGLLTVTLLLGVIFRNSAFIQRFTGKGYDTNPLPTHAVALPPFTGAEFTITTQMVSIADGLPTNFWDTEHVTANYKAPSAAKLTFDRAKASVIGGTIGTPHNVMPPYDVFVDEQLSYEPGETATAPWIRTPHGPGWIDQEVLRPDMVLMYQDVIDPTLRTQPPASVINETVHEIPVTTYSYTFTFGDFYESAPRLFELFHVVDGNADPDASVSVTVSLDEQWMVRYLDVNVDYHSVLDHRAKHDVGISYPYRYTMEVIKTTDTPDAVTMPANAVDPPIETTTTMTLPLVTP